MSTSTSKTAYLLAVVLIWAAIYLPALGTLEIKGEEGRRILPAVTMLQTGNFIVPQVGSDAYLAKPPLVNWLVAASFKVFGKRDEWAARVPSVLCVLAVGIAFVTIARGALGPSGSLIGAIIWMTNFGIIEKGRLIEIEALYVSLCGLAIICWLSWWQEKRSPWLTWIVPSIFLGLGLLAKGPLHLVFFYAVVVAILYQARELRMLWNPAHLIGVVLMLGIFGAWGVPFLLMMQDNSVTETWARQFSGRLSGEDFKLSGWLMNIPRGLGYFMPWVLLLPFARGAKFATDRETRIARGLVLAIAISFLSVSLLPGSLARYTMPLLVAAAWFGAMLLAAPQIGLPRWLAFLRPAALPAELRLPTFVALLVCLALALYAFAAIPFLRQREKVRNIAAQINAAIPAAEPLYAIDPDYQPFLFYVRQPIVYLDRVEKVPDHARYLLVQTKAESQLTNGDRWQPRQARPLLRLKDYRQKEVTVFEVGQPTH